MNKIHVVFAAPPMASTEHLLFFAVPNITIKPWNTFCEFIKKPDYLQSKQTEGIKSHNLQKGWKPGPYLLPVAKKCSVKTWNPIPIFCVCTTVSKQCIISHARCAAISRYNRVR